jgi:Rrf2 family protein
MSQNVQYSIASHIMAGLAVHQGREVTSADLAESVNTSRTFVRRTLSRLAKAGLVTTARGKNGSCRLSQDPNRISMLSIYQAVGSPPAFAIHGYASNPDCRVSRSIKDALGMVRETSQAAFEKSLAKIKLSDVVAQLDPA